MASDSTAPEYLFLGVCCATALNIRSSVHSGPPNPALHVWNPPINSELVWRLPTWPEKAMGRKLEPATASQFERAFSTEKGRVGAGR